MSLRVRPAELTAPHIAALREEYGYPFDCHCDDMWNTCACSAEHPGMETCAEPAALLPAMIESGKGGVAGFFGNSTGWLN